MPKSCRFFPRKIARGLVSESAMPIRAILFDLDDTLIVDEAVSRAALEATAEHAFTTLGASREDFLRDAREHAKRLHAQAPVYPYCRRIGISAFECLWGKFLGDTADLTALREWAEAYRVQVFDATLRSQQLEGGEAAVELAKTFAAQRRKLQRLMSDAREVLTRLAKKYRVGLLTNGAPDLQREKLLASGLEPLLHAVAVSGEHDIGKPLPGIFHRLLAELGAKPEEAVMVGNSLERDILGARNAGITSVWLKVPGSEEPAEVQPDYTIHGLAELPALLERLDTTAAH
jgi:putative hydrolase of the HAD superfamily